MAKNERKKTPQEMQEPVVDLTIDYGTVDTEPEKERPMGREYP